MDELQKIEANVSLVIDRIGPLSDVDFGLNRESVEWIEGYIERLRAAPDFDLKNSSVLASVLGSFLGACVIAAAGGGWHRPDDDDRLGVLLPNGDMVFPMTKVHKQFHNGVEAGDSISGFYHVAVDYIATGKLHEAAQDEAD
ncbi:hypothetical protein [Rhizohabitans arisaemae]|uniref:hypothetical protein n=1 Tax=Rhizohabitans arisaemae TaxID=2720610 RepID=UPI0024B205BC|nr:hypothetical protein [Rhizohabitans arisaemae]